MTIQTHFEKAGQRIVVRIIGDAVLFIDLMGSRMTTIEGLKLNKKGVEKEFPDLIGDPQWKQKAIERFVQKIKELENEEQRMDWIVKELKEMGYTPLFQQRDGFRPKKVE